MESSIINGTMLIQIAILAWLFLGERLSAQEVGGMVLAGLGTLVVQLGRGRSCALSGSGRLCRRPYGSRTCSGSPSGSAAGRLQVLSSSMWRPSSDASCRACMMSTTW